MSVVLERPVQDRQARKDLIVVLLLRYEEALGGTRNQEGQGDSYPHLPSTWNRSYRELHRCLKLLQVEDQIAYVHLTWRYVHPPRRRLQEVRERGRKLQSRSGHPKRWHTLPPNTQVVVGAVRQDVGTDVICIQWPDWIDPAHVARGLAWVEREFRGEPHLPLEFIRAA